MKLFKIIKKKTGEHVSLGYKNRSSWLTFPSEALRNNRHIIPENKEDEYEVEEYELVLKRKLTLKKKEIESFD